MFALPAILSQSSGLSNVFSYCPQDETLLQPDRLVNANFSYCPQDETLFQPDRLVNANFSYCPQDETLFPVHPPV
jgi:hypothetical protein